MEYPIWTERIISEPSVHHGDPCIKGTRIPVVTTVANLADGMTDRDIMEAYPQLTAADIRAALAYAADVLREQAILPLTV